MSSTQREIKDVPAVMQSSTHATWIYIKCHHLHHALANMLWVSYFFCLKRLFTDFSPALCGSLCPLIWISAHNILSKSSLHTHSCSYSLNSLYQRTNGIIQGQWTPTLHLRKKEKPFPTQRLFIISCVPFTLQSARKEYFRHKKRVLGQRTHEEMRKTKRIFFFFARGFDSAI